MGDDDAFERLLDQIRQSIQLAIQQVLTCQPTHLILGMSAETFSGGTAGNAAFTQRIRGWAGGLGVTTGAEACSRALEVFNARRLGIVTPYHRSATIRSAGTSPDVDVILQCGTNLSMVRLADEAERWLGKPVIAINAATFWRALRENGIGDRRSGFGSLLREY